ncbi:MAG: hypothetical protein RL339_2187 [Pseudomonadota bacterium]|jgi:hypothetical protein
MKKYLLAATGAMTLALSSNANAALVLNISGASGTYGNTNVTCAVTAPCSFNNSFSFSKPAGYQLVGATITSLLTGSNAATNINFSSVTLNGIAFAIGSTGDVEFRSITNQILGNWNTINVQGQSGGNASYSGTLSFAAVPEPSTWLMMILGVGIAGAALRRRRQNVTVSYA